MYNPVEKESVVLECEVSKANLNCVWKRYGKKIEPEDDKIIIETEGRVQRLVLKNVNMQDKQNISCIAIKGRNEDDELATTSTRIIVQGSHFYTFLFFFIDIKFFLILIFGMYRRRS